VDSPPAGNYFIIPELMEEFKQNGKALASRVTEAHRISILEDILMHHTRKGT
jgi:hypothetical protein